MKKKAFYGWRHIFDFTWKQAVNAKGFKSATVILAMILLIVGLAISTIMAYAQKESEEETSPIETVRIVDESGLEILFVDSFAELNKEDYPNLKLEIMAADWQKVVTTLGTEHPRDLIVRITHEEEVYRLTAIIPNESELTESDAEDFLGDFQICLEQSKLLSSGIEMDKLVYAMSGVSTELTVAGDEEKSAGEYLVSMLVPMLVIFVLYMMTLLYGQSITNVVSVEKSSKLMEMMLTMVRPEALIFGKIAATVLVALLQLGLWITCLVVGFFGGHLIAENMIYPEYNNVILEVFKLMQNQDGSTAFTVGAVVLFLVALCIGFLFYSVIAGLIASFASKMEEVAMCNAYYQFAVIAGFIGSYMLPLQEKDWLNTILRIVPITSAFLLPGDILVGNVVVWQGLLYLLLLLVFTLLIVYMAGKVYKSQVFNRGMSVFEKLKKKKA